MDNSELPLGVMDESYVQVDPPTVREKPSLSDLVKDAIVNSDCFCEPGDPTCQDWPNSDARWDRIHQAVMRVFDEETSKVHQSNLVDHARREYEIIGEDQDYVDGMLRIIQAFADMGHSGMSGAFAIAQLDALLNFRNLKPLTDDPAEWNHISGDIWGTPGGIWQSARNPEAFSNDGGITYYLLSEGGNDKNREPLHHSEKKS